MHEFNTSIGPHYNSVLSKTQYHIQINFGNDLKVLKGQNIKARGNAPGYMVIKNDSPNGAKYI
jgi:hypothetical protein